MTDANYRRLVHMTDANRRRLVHLITARARLAAAVSLVHEATSNVAESGLLPHETLLEVTREIDKHLQRISMTIERIP